MKLYDAVKWHGERAQEWENLRLGIGKYTKEKQELVLRYLNPQKNEKILDVGTGSGFYARYAAEKGAKVTAVDMSTEMLGVAKNISSKNGLRISFIKADAQKLPFKNHSFDKVVSVDLIEHLPQPEKFLKRIIEVIKPRGLIVIAWPHAYSPYRFKYYFEKLILQRSLPYTRWISTAYVSRWFESNGFRVQKVPTSLNVTAIILARKMGK